MASVMSDTAKRFLRRALRVLDYASRPFPRTDAMLRRILLLAALVGVGGYLALPKVFRGYLRVRSSLLWFPFYFSHRLFALPQS